MTEIPAPVSLPYADRAGAPAGFSRALHVASLATLVCTFPLIFIGGLVTSHGAGMSVPDWPNTYGYNMFLFPPSEWVGGILYEHTHRLVGTVVGFLAIVQAGLAWKVERRPWARYLHYGVLAFVVMQGILGGLRVVWVKLDLAILHACTGQLFFCCAGAAVLVSSPWWHRAKAPTLPARAFAAVSRLAGVAVALIAVQLVLGAFMRHHGAGLAIPDLPLAYGKLLPPLNADELQKVNAYRAWELHVDPVTLNQVWLHYGHRLGALAVSIAVVWLLVALYRRAADAGLVRHAAAIGVLLVVQFTLGLLVVYFMKPADITSYHVACGALLLLFTFNVWLRSLRLRDLAEAGA